MVGQKSEVAEVATPLTLPLPPSQIKLGRSFLKKFLSQPKLKISGSIFRLCSHALIFVVVSYIDIWSARHTTDSCVTNNTRSIGLHDRCKKSWPSPHVTGFRFRTDQVTALGEIFSRITLNNCGANALVYYG